MSDHAASSKSISSVVTEFRVEDSPDRLSASLSAFCCIFSAFSFALLSLRSARVVVLALISFASDDRPAALLCTCPNVVTSTSFGVASRSVFTVSASLSALSAICCALAAIFSAITFDSPSSNVAAVAFILAAVAFIWIAVDSNDPSSTGAAAMED